MSTNKSTIDNIGQFTVENNIFSFFIGTIIGFTASNIIKSFKTNILDYYLFKVFNAPNNNLIIFGTSILEALFILFILYLIYDNLFKKIINKYKIQQENQTKINIEILDTLKQINSKTK